MNFGLGNTTSKARKPVPRGIARSGPPVLSYGFRPFSCLRGSLPLPRWSAGSGLDRRLGDRRQLNWHAHEMLFGYTSAALASYMLTAVPNWTGRLPVSGLPLLGLVAVWLLGRLVMAVPDVMVCPCRFGRGLLPAADGRDSGHRDHRGKNWKNLKILDGLGALSLVNIAFHLSVAYAVRRSRRPGLCCHLCDADCCCWWPHCSKLREELARKGRLTATADPFWSLRYLCGGVAVGDPSGRSTGLMNVRLPAKAQARMCQDIAAAHLWTRGDLAAPRSPPRLRLEQKEGADASDGLQ